MSVDFLHGVEVVPQRSGVRSVRVVRAAVIGLVGIAPKGAINTPTLVSNETQAAQFGSDVPGFTIPKALQNIFRQGAGTVVVINVFDPDTMTATVTDETKTVANGTYTLDAAPIGGITVKNNAGTTTYVAGTHYSVDDFGKVTILDPTTIPNGTTLKTTYEKLDAALVTNAAIIGTVTVAGVRSGIKAFDDTYRLFGFNPRILIAPGYSHIAAVATELRVCANKFRARAIINSARGVAVTQAISNRGVNGNPFNTSDKRALLAYPSVKDDNAVTDWPCSYIAGAWCRTIIELGYHYSPSNKEVVGVSDLEQPVSWNPVNPAGTDANELNAAGILTFVNSFGSGFRIWGNRSAGYPSTSDADTFLSVLMTADIIDESVLLASLPLVDLPGNDAFIDEVRETVNTFLRTLIGRGALIDGVNDDGRTTGCYFDEEKNPPTEIAQGKYTFTMIYMPPTPAERITYDRVIDIQFLRSLTQTA